jgi:hypothetical protein
VSNSGDQSRPRLAIGTQGEDGSVILVIGISQALGIDARMAQRSDRLGVPQSRRVGPATGRVAKGVQQLTPLLQGLLGPACVDPVNRAIGAALMSPMGSVCRLFVQASRLFVQLCSYFVLRHWGNELKLL